jgi:uncharacterized phage protein gp47/JayE
LAAVTNTAGVAADVTAVMQAVTAGPVRANAGMLTEIVSPTVGWNTVTNVLDADLGQDAENDTALRIRREQELRMEGASSVDAIRADLLAVPGVLSAAVTEDDDAHTFSVILWDGEPAAASDDAIAQTIWESKPAGIPSLGSESGTAVDVVGVQHSVPFNRALPVYPYLVVNLDKDPLLYPADGDAQVEAAILAYAQQHYTVGSDVVLSALYGPIFSVAGVTRVAGILAGMSAAPTIMADIPIDLSHIARLDSSHITVNSNG